MVDRATVGIHAYGDKSYQIFEDCVSNTMVLSVRDVLTTVVFSPWSGFCTYVQDFAGSLFWSETGYRSFTVSGLTKEEDVRRVIEAHIDAKSTDGGRGGGCGGVLCQWWPMYALQWADDLSTRIETDDYKTYWGHLPDGDEIRTRRIFENDKCLSRMAVDGINPNHINRPDLIRRHKDTWPKFSLTGDGLRWVREIPAQQLSLF